MKKHKLVGKNEEVYAEVEMTERDAARRNAALESINDGAKWVPVVEDAQPSSSE